MNAVRVASIIGAIELPDVQPAAKVLASAFRGYPFFEYCFFRQFSFCGLSFRHFAYSIWAFNRT